ncbi:hypothetical protein H1D32_04715 [Anaerobacillus sp. CMMVII]|uniref:hypothetical protein n=1 Tax=Anaerobacillus sp. CMMVII TaxID=2755588 RepID=UPI0021B7FBFA|nr:hypothetical protein [Anaerobacillus sp. CMMVII]MCT8137102.1 hypothetical protein [Anaerobacillus sp. CMMVII]
MLWLTVIVVVLVIFIFTAMYLKKATPAPEKEVMEKHCKSCLNIIPQDYTKSLCPHCRKFLM